MARECNKFFIDYGNIIPNYSFNPLYVWFLEIMFQVADSDVKAL